MLRPPDSHLVMARACALQAETRFNNLLSILFVKYGRVRTEQLL